MLYLGWSRSDPYFKLVFGELLSRFGEMMRPGYAVMFDVTEDNGTSCGASTSGRSSWRAATARRSLRGG